MVQLLSESINWSSSDLVVVDEASMLTLEMLAGILAVVHPACRVVLVGDPHQLLSVGPGNVLPDLLALGVPHIWLSSFHRQTDVESALAHNVREFGAIVLYPPLKQNSRAGKCCVRIT